MRDAGFSYKDRRNEDIIKTSDPAELSRRKRMAYKYSELIDSYRTKIFNAIYIKDVFQLEKILNEINQLDDDSELYHHLRYDIIKA